MCCPSDLLVTVASEFDPLGCRIAWRCRQLAAQQWDCPQGLRLSLDQERNGRSYPKHDLDLHDLTACLADAFCPVYRMYQQIVSDAIYSVQRLCGLTRLAIQSLVKDDSSDCMFES